MLSNSGMPARHFAPGLDPRERDRFESPQLDHGRLELAKPRDQVRFLDHRDAERKGVDEHPDHRLHSRQLRGPTGDRDAEEDVAPAAVPGQQESPGALDQRAQREPARPRQRLEHGRQHPPAATVSRSATASRDAPRRAGERPSNPSGVAAVTPLRACLQYPSASSSSRSRSQAT